MIDEILAGRLGVEPVRRLLLRPADLAPGELLRGCLPSAPPQWHLLRSKFKPGRKLSAWYELRAPDAARPWRVAVTWQAGPAAPPPEQTLRSLDAQARGRGLAAPFTRLWSGSPDHRVLLLLAPLDPAFPHLVRFYDPGYVAGVLDGVPGGGGASGGVEVRPVRYRPGQRHVLRYSSRAVPGLTVFAKIYRDGTAVARMREIAGRLAGPVASGSRARIAGPLPASPDHRAGLWPLMAGRPLWQVLRDDPGSLPMAAVAGAALRAIHDIDPGTVAAERGIADEVAAAARACAHITGLLPALGGRLRRLLDGVGERVQGLPAEAAVLTHGDAKCDNLLVDAGRLTVIDLDRCGYADPALDIGKLLADLRWWCTRNGLDTGAVQAQFRAGYGDCDRARLARARAYEVLFAVKIAGRRWGVDDPGWVHRVTEALGSAESLMARLPCP